MRTTRRPPRGQSLVEFALILPVLLTLFGAAVDASRVYGAWIALESATRNAAEYAAQFNTTSAAASADAQRIVCAETSGVPGFTSPPGNPAGCTSPTVTVTAFTRSSTAAGASTKYPIASVTVQTTLPFRTFFAYPFLTQDGAWTLTATSAFSIVQGR
jgi:Flp pilus assembly protein TadG